MRKFDYSKFENCLWDNEILPFPLIKDIVG